MEDKAAKPGAINLEERTETLNCMATHLISCMLPMYNRRVFIAQSVTRKLLPIR